ncbi:hypothetical protein ACJJIL_12560 [Microbulbifer sp. EKSA005]|uniref:hypothetical protein n=1 Tax=Microbulbifer sp. EKSA005 TaxID=3243364 RepID=UPI00404236C7
MRGSEQVGCSVLGQARSLSRRLGWTAYTPLWLLLLATLSLGKILEIEVDKNVKLLPFDKHHSDELYQLMD